MLSPGDCCLEGGTAALRPVLDICRTMIGRQKEIPDNGRRLNCKLAAPARNEGRSLSSKQDVNKGGHMTPAGGVVQLSGKMYSVEQLRLKSHVLRVNNSSHEW